MSLRSEWESLIEIQRIAASLQMNTQMYSSDSITSPHPSSNTEVAIPRITLPFPEEIFDPLITLDIPNDLRQTLIEYLKQRVAELQDRYTAAYEEAYLASMRVSKLHHDLGSIQRVYQIRFQQRCLPMIEAQISQIVSRVGKSESRFTFDSHAKRPFNNLYTPLLEKYFEWNGYPPVAHRLLLAQKSMMAPRQIEVWFQNHRNRAKKEGNAIPRLDSEFPLKNALRILQQTVPINPNRLPTPPTEEPREDIQHKGAKTSPSQSVHSTTSPKTSMAIQPTFLDDAYTIRPLHAYPATRQSHYPDPFPSDDGTFKFPSPSWRRKAATSAIVSNAVDMDDFARIFHLKLNFSETQRRGGNTSKHQSHSCQPWFSATTTFASPAPHPALIRTLHVSRSKLPDSTRSMETSVSQPTFGSSSLPVSTAPSLSLLYEAPARKIRPLPRQSPHSPSNTFVPRTSSFGSDTSSGNRSSSSSSNFSSPELATPPSLPHVDLPAVQHVQQLDLFDFSHTDLDANYSLSEYLPSQDFSLADTYPVSDKFPDIPFFNNPLPNFSHNLGEIFS